MTQRTAGWMESPHVWRRLPWGLMTVNVGGSLMLGLVLGSILGTFQSLLAAGLCGTLTTFSSFGWQGLQAWRQDRRAFWLGTVVMTAGCIVAFGGGYSIAGAISG